MSSVRWPSICCGCGISGPDLKQYDYLWEKESGRKALSCENKPDSIKQAQDIENESLNELYKQKENE